MSQKIFLTPGLFSFIHNHCFSMTLCVQLFALFISSIQPTHLSISSDALFQPLGYCYNSSLTDRMSIKINHLGHTHKLKGKGPWTIGRSRHATISVQGNEAMSRVHGTISLYLQRIILVYPPPFSEN